MTAQQIMQDSHMTRIRALRDEVTRLKTELSLARDELESWELELDATLYYRPAQAGTSSL